MKAFLILATLLAVGWATSAELRAREAEARTPVVTTSDFMVWWFDGAIKDPDLQVKVCGGSKKK